MTTYAFHHVALSVHKMMESLRFYETFGFQEVHHYNDPAGTFEIAHLRLGDFFLELFCYRDCAPAPKSAGSLETGLPRIGVKHMALRVQSVLEARREIDERDIATATPLQKGNTGVTYFFIKDPSGNLLEILEDNRDL